MDTWRALKDRPKFPDDLPSSPYEVYGKEKNWKGFSDFLGSKPSAKYVEMWPFAKARNYVRSLKLASSTEYFKWANGGWRELPKKPAEVFRRRNTETNGAVGTTGSGRREFSRRLADFRY